MSTPELPSNIPPKPIEPIEPVKSEKGEAKTRKFGTLAMTKTQYNKFINNWVRAMLRDTKNYEKRLLKSLKRLGRNGEE